MLFASGLAILDVVDFHVTPVAGNGLDDRETIRFAYKRQSSIYEPLADEAVVIDLAGPGAVWPEVVVAAVKSDDRLSRRAMFTVFRDGFRLSTQDATLPCWAKNRMYGFKPCGNAAPSNVDGYRKLRFGNYLVQVGVTELESVTSCMSSYGGTSQNLSILRGLLHSTAVANACKALHADAL